MGRDKLDSSLKAGIDYLSSLAPWTGTFSGEWGLEQMRALMRALGDPQEQIPTIHVAGTNGKGSVSVAVAAILAQGRRRVALTTSPHLTSIRERVVIDGLPISEEQLGGIGLAVRQGAERAGVVPSFFEGITAAAFLAAVEEGAHRLVVEVGLGGRLDATNVITAPVVTVITSIDFDHEAILGSTLGQIAAEKAGILKQGVPAVVGRLPDEALGSVLRIAGGAGVPTLVLGRDFEVRAGESPGTSQLSFGTLEIPFVPSLRGAHQVDNMAVAMVAALQCGASPEECAAGVAGVVWPGRLERVDIQEYQILIDAAHNPAGIGSVVDFIRRHEWAEDLTIAFGAIETKRWDEMIATLGELSGKWLILEPDFERAVPAERIAAAIRTRGGSALVLGRNYSELLKAATTKRILVVGSIYLIGKVREVLGIPVPRLWESQGSGA